MKATAIILRCASVLLVLCASALGVPKLTPTPEWINQLDEKGKPREVIAVQFKDEQGEIKSERMLHPDSPAATQEKFYKVTNDGKALAVKIDKRGRTPGKLLSQVVLVPSGSFNSTKPTEVVIVNATDQVAFRFKGYQPLYATEGIKTDFQQYDYSYNQRVVKGNKAIEPKLSLKAGDGGAAVSLKAVTGKNIWKDSKVFTWQASLDADVALNKQERNVYIDSIIGEVDFLRVTPFGKPEKPSGLYGVSELALHGRIESDREFQTVNAVFGVGEWLALQHPGLARFAEALCFVGDYPDSPSAMILTLSYDYVVKISEDSATGDRLHEVGNNRLRTRLYWDLLLAHALHVPLLKQTRELSVLLDVGAIYDLDHGKFSPDTRLSLELSPTNPKPNGKEFSFVITYINGKTTPTFKHYDEFLAGIKIPF